MSYNESGEPIDIGVDVPDSVYEDGKRTYKGTLWGLPIVESSLVPKDCVCVVGQFGVRVIRITNLKKTISLSADVMIPIEIAGDMIADRALEILKRELLKATKKAVDEFVLNGIEASANDVFIRTGQKITRFSGTAEE